MTKDAAVQSANKKGNPCQLSCVFSMIACTMYGPTIDEARFERPYRLKNCGCMGQTSKARRDQTAYHVVESRRTQLSHHRLRVGVIRCLEQTKHDIVRPEFDQRRTWYMSETSHQNSHTEWNLEKNFEIDPYQQTLS